MNCTSECTAAGAEEEGGGAVRVVAAFWLECGCGNRHGSVCPCTLTLLSCKQNKRREKQNGVWLASSV